MSFGAWRAFDPVEWAVLSKLLDAALDVAPEQRERWLDSLPAQDSVHTGKLRQLLEQHAAAETRDFLDTLPKLLAEDEAGKNAIAPPGLPPGTQVGPYVIEEEIGRGGMGAVWRARRSDGVINRTVALKLPHAGLYSRELIERFSREREILAKLAHPNIARLYDAGLSSSGQPYLALEYVAGEPVTAYCDANRLDVRQRLRIFQQILRAVQYAHGHLVIHRDLKPTNVIVDADGQAMLLDFGIAKLIEPDAAEALDTARRTQVGVVPLTPDYASPEQIGHHPVTTASDIYSLGVLLFELLTGDRPYRLKRGSRAVLEEAILGAEPQWPSRACRDKEAALRGSTAAALAKRLQGDLDTIILKALKKSPTERYATADAFSQDIERYLRGEPVSARPDSGWYRTVKFIARHKIPVAAGATAVFVIVAVAAIALFEAHEADVQRDRALALSSRNEAVTDFLEVLITEAAQAARPVTVSDMLARSEALANSEYRGDPQDRAAVLSMLGIHFHTMGDDARAEPLLRAGLAAAESSGDPDLLRKLACNHAMALAGQGQVVAAAQILHGVIADRHTTVLQSALCLEYLAYMAQDAVDAVNAVKYGNLALARLSELKSPPRYLHATFLGSVGFAEHLRGRNAAANGYYQQSLAEYARAGRERSPDAIAVRNNWAIVSDGAGEPRRSLELYDQTLGIVAQNDPTGRAPPYLLGNRAKALESIGRLDAAREAYGRCMGAAEPAGASTFMAFCQIGLSSVLRALGDLAAARESIDKAAAMIGSAPPGSPPVVALKSQRGEIALAEGRLDAARTDLDSALAAGPTRYMTMGALRSRAELAIAEGNLAAAETDARGTLALAREQQGGVPYSNRTGLAWLTLGKVLAKKGEARQAHDAFQAAVANLANTVDAGHPMLRAAQQLAAEVN